MFSIYLIPELASSFNFQPGFSGSFTDLNILSERKRHLRKKTCVTLYVD